jgi:ankyrin repeat protein
VAAARNGNEAEVLSFLNKYPIYRDQSLPSGHAVLCVAARAGQYSLVRKLIDDQKCSINIQNVLDHKTALHYCVDRPANELHFDLICYLIRRGADMFLVSKPGTLEACTPFSLALGTSIISHCWP